MCAAALFCRQLMFNQLQKANNILQECLEES